MATKPPGSFVALSPHQTVVTVITARQTEQEDLAQKPIGSSSSSSSDLEAARPALSRKATNVDTAAYTASGVPLYQDGLEFKDQDPFLVTWESEADLQNPRNWSMTKKVVITFLTSLNAFMPSFSSSTLSPAMAAVAKQFGFATNETLAALCVSIFVLPWAFVPLVASPLSEIYGRKKLVLLSLWILFAFNLGCCYAQTKEQLIVCRFFAGVGGASPLSIGAGVIGDVWDNRLRNKAIGIFGIGLIMAPVVSPIISGFVVENKDWRWVLKILAILSGFTVALNHLLLRESYAPTILNKKKRMCIKADPNNADKYKTVYDLTDSQLSVKDTLYLNTVRPIYLLFYHPMVYGLGVFLSFINGFLYLMIVIFPEVWAKKYGYSIGISGLMFATMGVGFLLGIGFWTPLIDYTVNKSVTLHNGVFKPEFKLKLLIYGGIGGPTALLAFGWTVEKHVHWIVPSIFAALFAFATVNVFQMINNYLIDMNPRYGASAVAAGTVFRSLFGFVFPLFAPKMYNTLKFSWGNTLFFFIGIALGIPYPLFACYKGEALREWGNKKVELLNKRLYDKLLTKQKKKEQKKNKHGKNNKAVEATDTDDSSANTDEKETQKSDETNITTSTSESSSEKEANTGINKEVTEIWGKSINEDKDVVEEDIKNLGFSEKRQ